MPLTEIKGDLFNTPASIIMHGCNTQGVMGKGVALTVKKLYPEAFDTYVRHIKSCRDAKIKPEGRYSQVWTKGKLIVNLYTQEFYGSPYTMEFYGPDHAFAKVTWIHSSIQAFLSENINSLFAPVIAMPQIGCGLGGLKWENVKPILTDLSDFYDVDFLVYSL